MIDYYIKVPFNIIKGNRSINALGLIITTNEGVGEIRYYNTKDATINEINEAFIEAIKLLPNKLKDNS